MKLFSTFFIIIFFMLGCQDKSKATYSPELANEKNRQDSFVVGIHPYLNSKKMFTSYRLILDYLEIKLGVRLVLETSKDYLDYERKLYAGHFDLSLPNPYQTLQSFQHGYYAIARMKPDEVFRGIIIVRKDTNIQTIADLKGHKVSFPAPTALAATMMPLEFLANLGLDINRDIEKKFVGSQYSSIMNVYSKDTIAGATWPPPWESWKKENPKKAQELRVQWETKHLINNGFVVKNGLDGTFVRKLQEYLIGMDEDKFGKELLIQAGFEGFALANNKDFDTVQVFMNHYNQLRAK